MGSKIAVLAQNLSLKITEIQDIEGLSVENPELSHSWHEDSWRFNQNMKSHLNIQNMAIKHREEAVVSSNYCPKCNFRPVEL